MQTLQKRKTNCMTGRMANHDTLSKQTEHTRTTSAGWQIQRLAGALNRDMVARLGAYGLKLEHFVLLMALAEKDDLTQTELGGSVALANYTISRALDVLEDKGLVKRKPDATSRRAHRVFLTEAGRALMPALFSVVDAVNGQFLAPLNDDDRTRFLALLGKLMAR